MSSVIRSRLRGWAHALLRLGRRSREPERVLSGEIAIVVMDVRMGEAMYAVVDLDWLARMQAKHPGAQPVVEIPGHYRVDVGIPEELLGCLKEARWRVIRAEDRKPGELTAVSIHRVFQRSSRERRG